jgi:hypothetical protein
VSGDLCRRKGRGEWRAGAGGGQRKIDGHHGGLRASDSTKNGAARGQLGLDGVGGTGRRRGAAAQLQPCAATRWYGGSGCSSIGEQ